MINLLEVHSLRRVPQCGAVVAFQGASMSEAQDAIHTLPGLLAEDHPAQCAVSRIILREEAFGVLRQLLLGELVVLALGEQSFATIWVQLAMVPTYWWRHIVQSF